MLVVFTYLVTKDIVETLERKVGYKLCGDLKGFVRDLENQFLEEFWGFVPDTVEKKAIDSTRVSVQLDSISSRNGKPIVSLDRVYLTQADEYLEVTRVTDPRTGQVKISERPGNEPIERQINRLRKYQQIVLVDVGAFEGGTLLEICNLLEETGINIEEIYLGFSSNEANRRINNSRKLTALNLFDFYEWIEMRDFFGIDGRAVGIDSGIRTYIPYWENLSKWASIPKESEKTASDLCRKYYALLTERMLKERYDIKRIGTQIKYGGGK